MYHTTSFGNHAGRSHAISTSDHTWGSPSYIDKAMSGGASVVIRLRRYAKPWSELHKALRKHLLSVAGRYLDGSTQGRRGKWKKIFKVLTTRYICFIATLSISVRLSHVQGTVVVMAYPAIYFLYRSIPPFSIFFLHVAFIVFCSNSFNLFPNDLFFTVGHRAKRNHDTSTFMVNHANQLGVINLLHLLRPDVISEKHVFL